jgi:hypothetical protein
MTTKLTDEPLPDPMGEALTGSLLASGIIRFLLKVGLATPPEMIEIMDSTLLVLEESRARYPHVQSAIDHARFRLEGLRSSYDNMKV